MMNNEMTKFGSALVGLWHRDLILEWDAFVYFVHV